MRTLNYSFLLTILMSVFFQSCTKNGDDVPSNPPLGKKVISITKTFYNGSKRVEYIRYDIKPHASRDTISITITDSVEASPLHWVYWIAHKQYTFNPVTKNISQIVLQSAGDGKWNNISSSEYKMNFDFNRDGAIYAKMFMTELSGAPITNFSAVGDVVPDSGKLYLTFTYPNVSPTGPYIISETMTDGRFDKIDETGIYRPFLEYYFDLFIPGYRPKQEMNYRFYYNQNKRCDSLIIENGYYNYVPRDPFTWDPVWVGTATIKKHFIYSDDYAVLDNTLKNLFIMKQSIVLRNAETLHASPYEEDFYTFNESVSKSYTDSCFTVTNNQRTYVRALSYVNTILKDNTGNIESISRTNSLNNSKIVYSFRYE